MCTFHLLMKIWTYSLETQWNLIPDCKISKKNQLFCWASACSKSVLNNFSLLWASGGVDIFILAKVGIFGGTNFFC